MFLNRAVLFRSGIWGVFSLLFFGATCVSAVDLPGKGPGGAKVEMGELLFEGRCAICHSGAASASNREALAKLGEEAIYHTISVGVMKEQASGLSEDERRVIAVFLAGLAKRVAAPPLLLCSGSAPAFPAKGPRAAWKGWSPDLENTRFQSTKTAGLNADQVKRLELRWALVIPNASTVANQVTVSGEWMFLATQDGTIYALDPQTGCARWTYKAGTGVRTAVQIEGGMVYFGDYEANVYALDGKTGALRWKQKVEQHPAARITGAPTAYGGRLYVPVASLEEAAAMSPGYVCCSFRGSVVALDLATGRQLWKTYTVVDEPTSQGVNSLGLERRGPSGAGIWSAPTVDKKRGLLYVGTGNNYSNPSSHTADAILALDLRTGAMRWVHALTPSDVFNVACYMKQRANCPENEGPDFDIGSSPVLVHNILGRDMILVGQKSGVLYALDPERRGKLIWERRLGKGGSLGGIQWGFAVDSARAYVAISDQTGLGDVADGALNAVDLSSGKLLWRTANPPDACKDRPTGCSIAMAAPVTVMSGAVFAGSLDGHLRAYAAASGSLLWDFDTVRDVTGVNAFVGRGGSISGAGVTLANGFVYQSAGYAYHGFGMAGNVLLAFAPARGR